MALDKAQIERLIKLGLEEDLSGGDITTESIVSGKKHLQARVIAKEPLTICGGEIFRAVFLTLDPAATIHVFFRDGEQVPAGKTLIELQGDGAALLKGERTALNILQRLSGVATLTRKFVESAGPVTVLDTRKTTPGLRVFEKYAVACGGGKNHRFGLFDAVLIKDNHIKAAGGIAEAVRRVRSKWNSAYTIEVETTNMDEVAEALKARVDMIMLDNMPLDTIREAVRMVKGRAKLEVSGNVTLDRLPELAKTGIDYVSAGALTHSAPAVDISMNFF